MDLANSLEPVISAQPPRAPRGAVARLRRLLTRANWIFYISVALPTCLAIIYYGFFASDVYISESRYILRSPQRPAQTGVVGALLQGTGFSRSQDDTYAVHDFILSRDALKELDDRIGVRKSFSSDRIGIFDRFPGLLAWDSSFEALYRYYCKHVSVDYDPVSSISVLTAQAYDPETARDINDLLLAMAERLVNQLNERSRNDLIQIAAKEVQEAEERTANAAVALSAFRNKQAIFEPDKQSMIQLQGVAKLQEDLIATEAEQAQIESLSPTNPALSTLKSRADTLRKAIAAETAKVTGKGGSFTAKSATFEQLSLEKEFAEKQLALALATLETAKNEAQRKQLYLERLVKPNAPDHALEPRRLRSILTVFVFSLMVWGLLSLIVASIKEHSD